jgi:hypothetical protein
LFIERRIQARSSPEVSQTGLREIVDAVDIAADGSDVTICASVSETQLNQLLDILSDLTAT